MKTLKRLFILIAILISSWQVTAQTALCPQEDLTQMSWPDRFKIYSKIMLMPESSAQQECLLQYFYSIRKDFIIETLKGEENYINFFKQIREEFAVDSLRASPDVNVDILDHIAPLLLFSQQVWMEQALDRWIERKAKSTSTTTYTIGGGVLALTVALAYFPLTRKVTHRTLKVLMRVVHQTSRSRLALLSVPSMVQLSSAEDGVLKRYKNKKAEYELPLSPFELTHSWYFKKQQDLMDAEGDQFHSDLISVASGAALGTASGLTLTKLLQKAGLKSKPINLVFGVATTMFVTNKVESTISHYLTLRDFEKIIRDVSTLIYDIENKIVKEDHAKAYLALYGLVNEIEIYSLLKIRDFSLSLAEAERNAERSCLPAWTKEEVEENAKALRKKALEQFHYAKALMDYFNDRSNHLIKSKFPYFPDRLSKIKKFMKLVSSEQELASNFRSVIAEKNQCYQP